MTDAIDRTRDLRDIRRVAVIGAGAMGRGIAQVFAGNGFAVTLVDPDPAVLSAARIDIHDGFQRWLGKGLMAGDELDESLQRLQAAEDVGSAGTFDVAIEAVVEDRDVKRSVFRELDRAAPQDAILATNTSSISVTELAAVTARPERVVGMHFMNPVPVMELVEIVRGQRTEAATVETTALLARTLGKTPVVVEDFPGFVSNRVLMPMLNEAMYCVLEGVAGAEEVDAVMQLGMRHPLGPLALADLIGLDVCLNILEVLYRDLGDPKYRPCPLLRRMVASGRLGRKTGAGFHEY